jgi:NADH dehydrogenase
VRREAALEGLPRSPRIASRVVTYEQPERLVETLTGADCVVHLAGILFESRTSDYRTGNVESTRALVEAAQAAAARHIVFVSSLGANPRSSNGYFRSKGEAERLLADSGLDVTIIRTPLLLGPDTAGGRALRRTAAQRAVRVLGGGAHRLRPLDVEDLCDAVLNRCARPDAGVRTHDLVGPENLSYRELLERTADRLGHEIRVGSTPIRLAKLGAGLGGIVRAGGMTPAVIDVITSDEAVDRNADGDLGVRLTPLSDTLAKLCGTPTR